MTEGFLDAFYGRQRPEWPPSLQILPANPFTQAGACASNTAVPHMAQQLAEMMAPEVTYWGLWSVDWFIKVPLLLLLHPYMDFLTFPGGHFLERFFLHVLFRSVANDFYMNAFLTLGGYFGVTPGVELAVRFLVFVSDYVGVEMLEGLKEGLCQRLLSWATETYTLVRHERTKAYIFFK
jgi:hypothetical protein